MRVLFHVEPLLFHGRPHHYAALLDFFIGLGDCLTTRGRLSHSAWEVRFLTNPALAQRAADHHGIHASKLYAISERELREAVPLSSIDTIRVLQAAQDAQLLRKMADLYASVVFDYRPDVIITISPAPYLKLVFPGATILHVDGGLFSRDPLPHVFFLDPSGLFANSIIHTRAAELLALEATSEDRQLLGNLQAEFRRRVLNGSPFFQMEMEARANFRRLMLLPLQFAGEFGFDLHCSYDRQGSYLLDVAQRVSPDTAIIVSEHPTAIWLGDVIDPQTREYIGREYPNVIFAPGAREGLHHVGQTLLHHVDAVACVSSSLGMQAVFFEKPLLALGNSQLEHYATWHSAEEFNRATPEARDFTAAMAWMMRHYYMPGCLAQQENRLASYVRALAEKLVDNDVAQYPAFATDDLLLDALLTASSIKAA
ncbi:MAG: hypothetical protein ABI824_12250 [Acidobacteriota bacterium]